MKTKTKKSGKNTKEMLSVIRKVLRRGDLSAASESTGYSIQHISNVVAGRRSNDEIVKHLYGKIKKRGATKQSKKTTKVVSC